MPPVKATAAEVLDDLIAEQDALDQIVAELSAEQFELPTASPGWAIRDQIGHLAYFDRTAALAIADPDGFATHREELFGADAGDDPDAATLGAYRALAADALLDSWRVARRELATAAAALDDDTRVEWYGPSMGARSFLTARLMEAWAHGQDIVDVVGAERTSTDRIRHIAQLGVITRGWSYVVRGLAPPDADIAVILHSPEGESWTWGDQHAEQRVVGPATDFCLVVTQRRHVADTALEVSGDDAVEWMSMAQAFAGGPTTGPAPSN